jgi:hypothetical protein
MDERICSGHYLAQAFARMKELLKQPELLEQGKSDKADKVSNGKSGLQTRYKTISNFKIRVYLKGNTLIFSFWKHQEPREQKTEGRRQEIYNTYRSAELSFAK